MGKGGIFNQPHGHRDLRSTPVDRVPLSFSKMIIKNYLIGKILHPFFYLSWILQYSVWKQGLPLYKSRYQHVFDTYAKPPKYPNRGYEEDNLVHNKISSKVRNTRCEKSSHMKKIKIVMLCD